MTGGKLVPTVHVDMVLVTDMALAVLLGPPRLDILLSAVFAGLSSQPAGGAFIRALSSQLLRCLGTATIEAR